MIYVTKFDGSKQLFSKEKIIRTCLRMRASLEQAKIIADKIEKKAYDGISTKEILKMIFSFIKEFRPEVSYLIDLREAIAMLRPKPDFEQYIARLLQEHGYQVITNQIVQGKCVDHEVDIIAKGDREITYVEVKHHIQAHTYTGLDVFLEVKAALDDLKKGYEMKNNVFNFNKALVVCNTKISDHAKRFASCENIEYLGWRAPENKGIESLIEEKKLYPITFLKILKPIETFALLNSGVITLKDLVKSNLHDLKRKTHIKEKRLNEILRVASEILES
ncbi:MAG: YraN family protein [Candidatus Aenigmatarchaeota archaeon]